MSLPKVTVLSMGDMGVGIAKLLLAHGFAVSTSVVGRSQATADRAAAAGIALLPSDEAIVRESDVVLSVVPPRDAVATAQRIGDALARLSAAAAAGDDGDDARRPADRPLYFADLNAVSPATARAIDGLLAGVAGLRFVDGSIIGGPPAPPSSDDRGGSGSGGAGWTRPRIPTSGPHSLADASPALAAALDAQHLGDDVGRASGLKMCFASLTKGYAAIAVQAYGTAQRLGVLGPLQDALDAVAGPARRQQTERALTGLPPKAYRWVREMEEIGATFAADGGFAPDLFARGAAGVFRTVAEDTVLGQEKVGQRVRGRTAEDVAAAVAEGLASKGPQTGA